MEVMIKLVAELGVLRLRHILENGLKKLREAFIQILK